MMANSPATKPLSFECIAFPDLTPDTLHSVHQLRQRVFIVEQECVYLDADDVDRSSKHLLGWDETSDSRRLVAYARLLPPGAKHREPSIGRVITHPDVRGTGAGRVLMSEAIRAVEIAGWGDAIYITAQMYLERFYEDFGFTRVSEPYTEDNIWHVDMRRG